MKFKNNMPTVFALIALLGLVPGCSDDAEPLGSSDQSTTDGTNTETIGSTETSGGTMDSTETSDSSGDSDTTESTTETTDTGINPECGNGIVNEGEQCDDGNSDNTDECTNACSIAVCGDAITQADVEECDDGNLSNLDFCSSECMLTKCGDHLVQNVLGEECDDGNQNSADNCTNDCRWAECGDGIQKLYGNSVEECDDGDNDDTDGCPSTCELAYCGDGFLHAGFETCDDGNGVNRDGCNLLCEEEDTEPNCREGALETTISPNGLAVVCDPPNNICKEDYADVCPLGWHLCAPGQFNAWNGGWESGVGLAEGLVGQKYCRFLGGCGSYRASIHELEVDSPFNCTINNSSPNCESNFGCDEEWRRALCCAPLIHCGDGVKDGAEECDDGNDDDTDSCTRNCTLVAPWANGIGGC